MQPIIIYTMARTKGSATLEACVYKNKIWEPFNNFQLFGIERPQNLTNKAIEEFYSEKIQDIMNRYSEFANNVDPLKLKNLIDRLNNNDTVSKVLCNELKDFLPARNWFYRAQQDKTHKIFVLIRDLREQMFSQLLARKFGYFKEREIKEYPVEIEPSAFRSLLYSIDNFLLFLPSNAEIITFENLPKEYFDYSLIKIEKQDSIEKIKYIKNIDYCEDQIEHIIKYYKDEWNKKLDSLL